VPLIDEFFDNVVLLYDFAGADAATNITDLSGRGHVETFVADAQVDTDLQVLETNSGLFDGTGDIITVADSADWDFELGDFTVEFHVYFSASTGFRGLVTHFGDAPGGFYVQLDGDLDLLEFGYGEAGAIRSESWTPTNDTWYHIAVSRKADVIYLFVDGVELGTGAANTLNFRGGILPVVIGALRNDALRPLDGNIGAVRITKGVGRYDAGFTPPSVFYPLQGPTTNPIDPDFSSVVLLLDFEGAGESQNTTDLSDSGHTDIWVGADCVIADDVQYLLQNTLRNTGGGSDGYLKFADSADWDFGTGDFTVEFAFQTNNYGSNQVIIGNDDGVDVGWQFHISSTDSFRWSNETNVLIDYTHGLTVVLDWLHMAISRSGTTTRMFLNGVKVAEITDTSDYSGSAIDLFVATWPRTPGSLGLLGNIGQLRITKGVARYTANFTPPTQVFPTS
jgi:hypothetical protein